MGNAMKPDQASQAPPAALNEIGQAFADGMKEEAAHDRLWHGFAIIWNVAALVLYVCGWPGIAGLCIWAATVISIARLVRE